MTNVGDTDPEDNSCGESEADDEPDCPGEALPLVTDSEESHGYTGFDQSTTARVDELADEEGLLEEVSFHITRT